MIKILHTADLHLGAPFPSLGEKESMRQSAFMATFDRLLTTAIKNEVDLFVVAGDLFDSATPDPVLIAKVQAGLDRLVARGVVPILLPGTHDSLVVPNSVYATSKFSGAVVFEDSLVEEPILLNVRDQAVWLYGFAYRSFASEKALESMKRVSEEGVHLGVLHGSRQGSPEWEYRKKDLPFTLDLLKGWDLDYVALGHYHQYEVINEGGRLFACYPGSPEGKRFGENDERFCALVTIESGRALVEEVPVNTHVLVSDSLDLSGFENEESVIGAIRERGDNSTLLRLTLEGIVESPLNIASIKARSEDVFFHLELVDETHLFCSSFVSRLEKEDTVRGVFVRKLNGLLEESPEEEKPVFEEAFREVLVRFQAFEGGSE